MKFCRIEVFPSLVGVLAFSGLLLSGWVVVFIMPWPNTVRLLAVPGLLAGSALSWHFRGKSVAELVWRESRQWRLLFTDGSSVDGSMIPPLLNTPWLVGAVLRVEGHARIPFLVGRWQTRAEDWPLLVGLLRNGR